MLLDTVKEVVDRLHNTAHVAASADPRNLSVPGVWVTVDELDLAQLAAGQSGIRLQLVAVARGSHLQALEQLDQLVAAVDTVYPVAAWSAASILLPNHAPDPLPCLRGLLNLTWTPDHE